VTLSDDDGLIIFDESDNVKSVFCDREEAE